MKCICCNCGKIFEEKEIKIISEYRGEYWGIPCFEENIEVSPCCEDLFDNVEEEN